MPHDFTNPKYWFDRAEEVRTRAGAMKDPANKAKMLRIAEDYEDLGLNAQLVPKKSEDSHPPKTV